MTELYDLHCHSRASDGALSPTELVQRAQLHGVTTLALTDHDTTAGLPEAQLSATEIGIKLIPGIELSSNWQNMCFHIVGLGIDPTYTPLAEATFALQNTRMERAEKIAAKLENRGIAGSLAAVTKAAGDGMVTRTHFSDFLMSQNHVSNQQEAFDRYLAKGKIAYVPTSWAELELVVSWITGAGGVAVLAHPLRYKLKGNALKRLLNVFKDAGGQGVEVVTSRMNTDEIRQTAGYATCFDLAGSVGSDFHHADNPWVELGRLAPLPENIKPIWELLN
jgi:predicted metal-dependent phosphoesterase TrpH